MKSEMLAAMVRHAGGLSKDRKGNSSHISNLEHGIGHIFRSAELQGSAFGMAYVNGRFGDKGQWDIPGTGAPGDLVCGLGLHGIQALLSLTGRGARFADHTHSVADGLIANYTVRFGMNLGLSHRPSGGAPKVQGVHGRRYHADGTPADDFGNRAAA